MDKNLKTDNGPKGTLQGGNNWNGEETILL